MRAGGDGDLRGKTQSINLEGTEPPPDSHRTSMFAIHATGRFLSVTVRVHPRARKNEVTGQIGDALKLSLTTPPVEGRANQACIEFFAKLLKVPRSSVTIASGLTSRNKVIRVAGLSAAELRERLAL